MCIYIYTVAKHLGDTKRASSIKFYPTDSKLVLCMIHALRGPPALHNEALANGSQQTGLKKVLKAACSKILRQVKTSKLQRIFSCLSCSGFLHCILCQLVVLGALHINIPKWTSKSLYKRKVNVHWNRFPSPQSRGASS